MYIDKEAMFSQDQALTATGNATNIVDMGAGDAGPAEGLSLFVHASAPYTGSGTLTVNLQTAEAVNAAGTALESPVILASYPIQNAALLKGGKLLAARLPHGCKRYISLSYTVAGTIVDGKLTSFLTLDAQTDSFPSVG
jgi:hypothetical protein